MVHPASPLAVIGRGDYSQVTSMQPVGRGNGEFTREKVVVQSGPTLTIDDQRFHLRYNLH